MDLFFGFPTFLALALACELPTLTLNMSARTGWLSEILKIMESF